MGPLTGLLEEPAAETVGVGRAAPAEARAVTAPIKVGLFSTDFAKAASAIAGGSGTNQSSATVDGL